MADEQTPEIPRGYLAAAASVEMSALEAMAAWLCGKGLVRPLIAAELGCDEERVRQAIRRARRKILARPEVPWGQWMQN